MKKITNKQIKSKKIKEYKEGTTFDSIFAKIAELEIRIELLEATKTV